MLEKVITDLRLRQAGMHLTAREMTHFWGNKDSASLCKKKKKKKSQQANVLQFSELPLLADTYQRR